MRLLVHYLYDTSMNWVNSYVYIWHNRKDCIRWIQEELQQYLWDESYTVQELMEDKVDDNTEVATLDDYEMIYTNNTLVINNDEEQYSLWIKEIDWQFGTISEL